MPSVYEYFGILFLFHSDDHLPIHIHARHSGCENKYELIVKNGEVVDIVEKRVKGRKELPPSHAKDAKILVKAKKQSIIKKWEQVFVEKKKIELVKITYRLPK